MESDERALLGMIDQARANQTGGMSLSERARASLHSILSHSRVESMPHQLIDALNAVADVVSSSMDVEEVLAAIAGQARAITNSDKAVIVLTEEHGHNLDHETIAVRGRRSQHPQDWWEERLEALGEQVFHSGAPVFESHPETNAVLVAAPVLVKDRPVGLLCVINGGDHPLDREHVDFLSILAAFAASAIDNARLAQQGRYVLIASERDRIASEMHDGVLQSLFSLSLGLELAKKQLARDPDVAAASLEELQDQLKRSMTELRRCIYDLRPMKLAELGLAGAVEYWVRQMANRGHIRGRVTVSRDLPPMTPAEEACLYSVAKEAVSNVLHHAKAESVEVTIEPLAGSVELCVTDDGVGYDAERGEGGSAGLGIESIRSRVIKEGGCLQITNRDEGGTRLCVRLPVGKGA